MFSDKNLRRSDYSLLGQWRWTIDGSLLSILILMAIMGIVLSFTASPPVAERIGYNKFHFVYRQAIFGSVAIFVMIFLSFFSLKWIRRLALIMFLGGTIILLLLPFIGFTNNGATRWIIIPLVNLSIQPSEFVKPALILLSATLLAEGYRTPKFPGYFLATLLYVLILFCLFIQPDIGMMVVVFAAAIMQFYVAGLSVGWFLAFIPITFMLGWVAWLTQPHVQLRLQRFLETINTTDLQSLPYQVARSLLAFKNGGITGMGPGAGTAKIHLPDAHTDYIFAVIGEEFGLVICLLIILLVAFVVIRSLLRASRQKNHFVMIATSGLVALFALQSLVNLASTLNIIPPKGMTLPFISYGGSSTLALAFLAGTLLSLTRERPWDTEDIYYD